MKTRWVTLGACAAALAALALASSAARAQKTDIATFSGTSSGSGTVSRTITDVPEPGGPALNDAHIQQIQSINVSVPVTPGQSAATIGTNFRDAVNANLTLQSLGYSCVFSTPNGVADPTRPKFVKQTGGYTWVDGNTAPGVTFAPATRTVLDAPAVSPVGLGSLIVALPALAFWRRRRKLA